MSHRQLEVEQKFTIEPGRPLPDLTGIEPGVRLADPQLDVLEATYFDTTDLRLLQRGITLRRRTGSDDEGWHLKIPVAEASVRLEIHAPLGAAGAPVPSQLLDHVRAHVRRAPLAAVATIRTERSERRLLDADGATLATVADDLVRARQPKPGSVTLASWREVEVELVDGDDRLLTRAAKHLRAAGLEASPFSSKLHHAVGSDLEDRAAPSASTNAGDVVLTYLDEQIEELLEQDPAARFDEPDGVHKMRVATRRLRSTLRTYRPLFDRAITDPLRDELKWLGELLGQPRDAEVQRENLTQAARELPTELRVGPIVEHVRTELRRQHQDAHARLVNALRGERYFRLLDGLDALRDDPPFADRADRPADAELDRLLRRALGRVAAAARTVDEATSGDDRSPEQEVALHEVRKAAKKARYAAETARPALGGSAKRTAKRMRALQDLLGGVQDSVESRATLRRLAMTAHLAGGNGFSFGLLYGRQECDATHVMDRYPELLRRALAS